MNYKCVSSGSAGLKHGIKFYILIQTNLVIGTKVNKNGPRKLINTVLFRNTIHQSYPKKSNLRQ